MPISTPACVRLSARHAGTTLDGASGRPGRPAAGAPRGNLRVRRRRPGGCDPPVAPTRPAKTAATWRATRCSQPACRRGCPGRRSTACVPADCRRWPTRRARSVAARAGCTQPGGAEHVPGAVRHAVRRRAPSAARWRSSTAPSARASPTPGWSSAMATTACRRPATTWPAPSASPAKTPIVSPLLPRRATRLRWRRGFPRRDRFRWRCVPDAGRDAAGGARRDIRGRRPTWRPGARAALFAGGVVTAGNASGINDEAAVVLLGDRAIGEREASGRWRGSSPAPASASSPVDGHRPAAGDPPRALQRAGIDLDEVGLIEINEAFAPQVWPA